MEIREFCALACALCFTACSNPSRDEVEIVNNLYPLQFSLELKKEIIPFPSTRSMPENDISEPTSGSSGSSSDTDVESLCRYIEYFVYLETENEQTLIKHKHYTSNDGDFSIVYDTLPKGNYLFCFLAHNSQKAIIENNMLSVDTVSDSFYNHLQLNINSIEIVNRDISLQRAVGRIEFRATDALPSKAARLDMTISNYPNCLNPLTGEGISNAEIQTISYIFKPEEVGKKELVHAFYTFIPAEEVPLTAIVSTVDSENNVLRERTVSDILPQLNRIIRYSGILYGPSDSDDTFRLTISGNGDWESSENKDLPD